MDAEFNCWWPRNDKIPVVRGLQNFEPIFLGNNTRFRDGVYRNGLSISYKFVIYKRWLLKVKDKGRNPKRLVIIIIFLLFQQDCEYDSVEVCSGSKSEGSSSSKSEAKVHGTFCGTTLPQSITSEGHMLRITFSTDNTVQKSGFSATFITG